jgi:transcriptional regulator with XRE-family HTH domain
MVRPGGAYAAGRISDRSEAIMTTGATWTRWRNPPIDTQDTQPLPMIQSPHWQPTLKELRLHCGVSREQLAQASGVRLCRVYWMEHGIETPLRDAVNVLRILSQVAHRQFCVAGLRGLRVRIEQTAYADTGIHKQMTYKRRAENERSNEE